MLSVNDLLICSGCTMFGFTLHGSSVQINEAQLCPTVFDLSGKTIYRSRSMHPVEFYYQSICA